MTIFGGSTRTSVRPRSSKIRKRLLVGAAFAAALVAGPIAQANPGPEMSRTPSSMGFGNVQVAETSFAQFISVQSAGDVDLVIGTVALTGTNADQFQITTDNCSGLSLSPGSFCSVAVEFAPTSTGAKSAAVSIPSNDPTPPANVTLSGTGVDPNYSRTPSSLAYGSVQVAETSFDQFISIKNEGVGPLDIGTAALTGTNPDQFQITSDSCSGLSHTPGSFCSIAVEFTPTSTGAKSASVSIPTNDPSPPGNVTLTGTGVDPNYSRTPPSLAFGSVQVAETSFDQFISIKNEGAGPLNIGAVALTGTHPDQFQITSDSCSGISHTPGSFCSIAVEFTPTSTGAKSASVSIPTNDPTPPANVTLTGTGVDPNYSRTPSALAFGNQQVGGTGFSQFVSVKNEGVGPLEIGTAALTGINADQFQITSDSCSGLSHTPGSFCSIAIEFIPTSTGAKSASVSIPSNDPTPPANVTLTGTGVTGVSINPAAMSFGSRELGTTSPAQIATITNNADDPVTLGSAAIVGVAAADYAIAGDECSGTTLFFEGDSCQIDVTFSPTALGARTAAMEITSGPSTLSVSLNGTGIDTIGPACTWTTTTNSIRVSLLQSVNGHCSDLSGVASATIKFTDVLGSTTSVPGVLSPCSGGNKSCDLSAVVPVLLPGLYTVEIESSDVPGHVTSAGPTISLIVI